MWSRIILILSLSWTVVRAQVVLAADSLSVLPGTAVEVPVRVQNWQDIISGQGTIEWNFAVLDYDTVFQFGLPGMNPGNFGTSLTANGQLTFSWNEPNLQGTSLPDSSVVFALRFLLNGPAGSSSTVEPVSSPTALEFVDENFNGLSVTVVPGWVQIEDTTAVGWEEIRRETGFQIYPNPVNANTFLKWEGAVGAMKWRLRGLNGQIVKQSIKVFEENSTRWNWGEEVRGEWAGQMVWLEVEVNGRWIGKKIVIE